MSNIKNILFLSDNFPPEVNAPASRTYDHCREWVKSGAKVTVITCFPNFPKGKVFDGYKNQFFQREVIDGISVIRVWSFIAANKGMALRVLDFLSFALTSFLAGLFVKADVIVATSPQFFTTWSAFALSRLRRIPWIFELRDIWPESIKTVGAMKAQGILTILEKIELYLYKDSKLVIAVTDSFKKNLIRRGIDGNKIHVVTNGVDLSLFLPQKGSESPRQKLRNRLGLKDHFIIGYIGTHGLAHSLDFVINTAKELENPKVHFLFIGDGAMKLELMRLAESHSLKNVTFLDSVRKQEIPDYVAAIDVALVPLKKSDTFLEVIPSKIFESAAMEKPILLGVDGEARSIIEKFGCGIYFEPENKSEFLSSLAQIQDPAIYENLKRHCAALARAYDRKFLAAEMLRHIASAAK